MSADDIKLLPCPFCGGPAERQWGGEGESRRYGCSCASWNCVGHAMALRHREQQDAIDEWNCRAAPSLHQQPDEQVKMAFDEWIEKTEFIQQWIASGRLSVKYLGWHRADVMRDLIERAAPSPQGDADTKILDWLEAHFTDINCIYKDAAGEVRSLYIDCDDDTLNDGDQGRIRAAVADAARSTPATEKGE